MMLKAKPDKDVPFIGKTLFAGIRRRNCETVFHGFHAWVIIYL